MSENIKKNLLKVREMTIEDAEETAQIEAENFSKPWKKKDFEDAVRSKNTLYMVIENQDEIIGYAGMWLVLDEGEITNVSIKKSCWGQRVGTHLMEEFLKEAEKRGGTSFFLEVRESNLRARKLYRSFGFEEIDVRKKFYEEPVEDGIVMCKR